MTLTHVAELLAVVLSLLVLTTLINKIIEKKILIEKRTMRPTFEITYFIDAIRRRSAEYPNRPLIMNWSDRARNMQFPSARRSYISKLLALANS